MSNTVALPNTLYVAPSKSLSDPDHRSLGGDPRDNSFTDGDEAALAAEEMDETCPLDDDEWVICYRMTGWPGALLTGGEAIEAFEKEKEKERANAPAEICTLIQERQTGVRRLGGTEWPVVDQIHRVQKPSGRVFWRLTYGLCNGVPDGAEDYTTRRKAWVGWAERGPNIYTDDGLAEVAQRLDLLDGMRLDQ